MAPLLVGGVILANGLALIILPAALIAIALGLPAILAKELPWGRRWLDRARNPSAQQDPVFV